MARRVDSSGITILISSFSIVNTEYWMVEDIYRSRSVNKRLFTDPGSVNKRLFTDPS